MFNFKFMFIQIAWNGIKLDECARATDLFSIT